MRVIGHANIVSGAVVQASLGTVDDPFAERAHTVEARALALGIALPRNTSSAMMPSSRSPGEM
jgi:hypothetical protein